MSSIDRRLLSSPLHFQLGENRAEYVDENLLARSGRSARTLLKDGPLRVTLVALAAGGTIAPHRARGPITVQVLSGMIRFRTSEDEWLLKPHDLLSLGAGVEHAVESDDGGIFLLTLGATQER